MDNEIINNTMQQVPTMENILKRIDMIIEDSDYIREALHTLKDFEIYTGEYVNVADARAVAIGEIVKNREVTNQQTLRFLEKMYDDLKPIERFESIQANSLDIIKNVIEYACDIDGGNLKIILDSVQRIYG
ncbi:MAG: hypothetical protein FWF15_09695 [Oscillospiraceae bacterium]|nr:hypothetical protein [Oscillospiraceae bacterium]